jgi:hypothetical protein
MSSITDVGEKTAEENILHDRHDMKTGTDKKEVTAFVFFT